MKELPEALQLQAQDIKRTFESRNWKNIVIGLPDYSAYHEPSIFVHAISPTGKRFHYIFIQSDSVFRKIGEFLDSNTN